jgi:hypothetical protein
MKKREERKRLNFGAQILFFFFPFPPFFSFESFIPSPKNASWQKARSLSWQRDEAPPCTLSVAHG